MQLKITGIFNASVSLFHLHINRNSLQYFIPYFVSGRLCIMREKRKNMFIDIYEVHFCINILLQNAIIVYNSQSYP